MPSKEEMQKKWMGRQDQIRSMPKWIRRGTMASVEPGYTPTETEIEGKWGKRKVNVVQTAEFGLVYVDDITLAAIVEGFIGNNFSGPVRITL